MDAVLVETSGDRLGAAELYAIMRLRQQVFVVEQECPYPDADGRDLLATTVHLWLRDECGEALAVVRLLDEGSRVRIGRVCTAAAERGRGLAGRLMERALEWGSGRAFVLDAQQYLVDWYAGHGFVSASEPFDEDGIPHVTMTREARH